MKKGITALIRLYQLAISPFLPPCCRFHPSCSEYARQALEKHGIVKGGILSLLRISKCHPFNPGGYDPVP
ncbi:MAG: membrane protein insertion efficiency factor YidD [Deltaproteobacteria bacterium]|nr:MAG: membrane protein insertion efficiency factor YidD [Deltaproteobacteria bacterium]HDG97747.1 membrane protein insertion efficiency factor YidD [Desulfobacterales bacterium]